VIEHELRGLAEIDDPFAQAGPAAGSGLEQLRSQRAPTVAAR
jgi:hypothetical protein